MISSLYVNNLLSTDEKFVFISTFYQKWYTSAFDPQLCSSFFDKVCTFIPKISQESPMWTSFIHQQTWCSCQKTKQNKEKKKKTSSRSPGPVGLAVFWILQNLLGGYKRFDSGSRWVEYLKVPFMGLFSSRSTFCHFDLSSGHSNLSVAKAGGCR